MFKITSSQQKHSYLKNLGEMSLVTCVLFEQTLFKRSRMALTELILHHPIFGADFSKTLKINLFFFVCRYVHDKGCVATTGDITVSVSTSFLPELSSVHPPHFFFTYRIRYRLSVRPPVPYVSLLCRNQSAFSE